MSARAWLVAIAALGPGCLIKPDRVALDSDGGVDAAPDGSSTTLVPRVIANAYFASGFTPSPGMTALGYAVPTTGVNNGDLLLFIANVDNGSQTVWPGAVGPGFHQLVQQYFGSDGQTVDVSWKIADNEPAAYTGSYGAGVGSSAATITLLAIAGADPTNPIHAFVPELAPSPTTPVAALSPGVTTTVPGCTLIYAAGADWLQQTGAYAAMLPADLTELASFGDVGGAAFDWTTQVVAYRGLPAIGGSAPIAATLVGTHNMTPVAGHAWTVAIAVAPAP